jgi:hypothetical protein
MEVIVQLHTPAALTPGEDPAVFMGQEAGWVPQPVWTWCRRKKLLAPLGGSAVVLATRCGVKKSLKDTLPSIVSCRRANICDYQTLWRRVLIDKLTFTQLIKIRVYPTFHENRNLLPSSQHLSFRPYPEPE